MSDAMMRQRMFRENVRNEAQDSAVILHDIEIAKKFPSDWENISLSGSVDPHHATASKIGQFIGRNSVTVRRVIYASKELTPKELEEIKRVREQKTLERKKKQGLKEWSIQGIKVIALNRKNAERKAARIAELLKQDCA